MILELPSCPITINLLTDTDFKFCVNNPSTENTILDITTTNADTFTWQISTDNGTNWTDLIDDTTYQNTNTEDLSITNINTGLHETSTVSNCTILQKIVNYLAHQLLLK